MDELQGNGQWARRRCLACGKLKRVTQFDASRAKPGELASVCQRCKYGVDGRHTAAKRTKRKKLERGYTVPGVVEDTRRRQDDETTLPFF